MDRSQVKLIAAIVFAAAAAGFVLVALRGPKASPIAMNRPSALEIKAHFDRVEAHRESLRETPRFLGADEPSDQRGSYAAVVERNITPTAAARDRLSPERRRLLAEAVGARIDAVIAGDAEAFLSIIEREGYVPTAPDSLQWRIAGDILRIRSDDKEPVDTDDPIGTLRRLYTVDTFGDPQAFIDAGITGRGVRVGVEYTHDPETFGLGAVLERQEVFPEGEDYGPQSMHYWLHGSSSSTVLTRPIRDEDDIIARDGGVLAAFAGVVLFRDDATPCTWNFTFVWDRDPGLWRLVGGFGSGDDCGQIR